MTHDAIVGMLFVVQGILYAIMAGQRIGDDDERFMVLLLVFSSVVFIGGGVMTMTGGWVLLER